MNPDGSGERRLTEHPADDLSPRWSPDSAAISFVSWREGNAEVYVTESKRAVQEADTE